MSNFKVDASTFASIKQDLIDRFSANPAFADYDFLGSRLNNIVEVMAYSVLYSQSYSNAALTESFQSTAKNRNSIVLKSQDLGFIPSGRLAAWAKLNITTGISTSLSRYSSFESIGTDGVTYNFINWDSKVFVSSSAFTDDVDVYQGEIRFKQWNWVDGNRLLIRDNSIDRTKMRVTVNDIEYTKVDNSVRVNSTDNVFYARETIDGFTELYFGEGVVELRSGQEDLKHYVGGVKPINNDVIKLEYLSSKGALSNGSDNWDFTDSVFPATTVEINNITEKATTGADIESKERIQKLAPKKSLTQNRAVTADDYQVMVMEQYGSYIESILAWGDNTKPGFAFISIKPTDGLSLPQTVKSSIENYLSKYNILTIDALVVDPDYMFIEHTIEVDYTVDKLQTNEGSLETSILDAIKTYYSTNVEDFNKSFHLSRLLANVDSSDTSILGSSATIRVIKENDDPLSSDGIITFSNPITERGLITSGQPWKLNAVDPVDTVYLISTDSISNTTVGDILIGPFSPDVDSSFVGSSYPNNNHNTDLNLNDRTLYWKVGTLDYATGDVSYDITSIFVNDGVGSGFAGASTIKLLLTPTETDIYTNKGELIVFENELRPEYTIITLEGIT